MAIKSLFPEEMMSTGAQSLSGEAAQTKYRLTLS
jgi:hypothetical protein